MQGIDNLLKGYCTLRIDGKGILVNITKAGIGIAKKNIFYPWEEVISFEQYRRNKEDGLNLDLAFSDKTELTVTVWDNDLYYILKRHFPEKEFKSNGKFHSIY
jgi:hypothetical protein